MKDYFISWRDIKDTLDHKESIRMVKQVLVNDNTGVVLVDFTVIPRRLKAWVARLSRKGVRR